MSTTDESRALALRYLDAVRAGDLATVDRLQHRDATWWVAGAGSMTRETFMGMVETAFATVTERRFTVLGMTVEGERVAFELDGEITFPDKIYRNTYHNLLVIRDGLIVEGKEYMDTVAAQRAFGGAAAPQE